jgi:hypothetical protein
MSVVDESQTFPLMMEAEMVSEMLGSCPQLTWLVALEDFIKYNPLQSAE